MLSYTRSRWWVGIKGDHDTQRHQVLDILEKCHFKSFNFERDYGFNMLILLNSILNSNAGMLVFFLSLPPVPLPSS